MDVALKLCRCERLAYNASKQVSALKLQRGRVLALRFDLYLVISMSAFIV